MERCAGCGGEFEAEPDGATHAYIGASAGCWAAFNTVLAREFGDLAYGRVHRHTVDVYTVQHPGSDGRRQRQSVALHLVGLCHWLEHDLDVATLNQATQRLAAERREWPWLEPPSSYRVTVLDVLAARDGAAHVGLVRDWATDVWSSWASHHALVREWAAEALSARPKR